MVRAREFITEEVKTYYHGSNVEIPIGTILKPNYNNSGDKYLSNDTDQFIEKYRPPGMCPRHHAIYMVLDYHWMGYIGGGAAYAYTVEPLSKVEPHDYGWIRGMDISDPSNPHVSIKDPNNPGIYKYVDNYRSEDDPSVKDPFYYENNPTAEMYNPPPTYLLNPDVDIKILEQAAKNYWNGVPCQKYDSKINPGMWEYLTAKAKIIAVKDTTHLW